MSERSHPAQAGHGFDQDFQSLAVKLRRKQADPGDVAARLCERSGETFADQILAHTIKRYCTRRSLKPTQIGLGTAEDNLGLGFHHGCHAVGNLLRRDAVVADYDKVLTFHKAVDAEFIEKGRDRRSRGGNE